MLVRNAGHSWHLNFSFPIFIEVSPEWVPRGAHEALAADRLLSICSELSPLCSPFPWWKMSRGKTLGSPAARRSHQNCCWAPAATQTQLCPAPTTPCCPERDRHMRSSFLEMLSLGSRSPKCCVSVQLHFVIDAPTRQA